MTSPPRPWLTRLLHPGVVLMRALPYGRKFLLVAVCMLAPMLVMAALLLNALRQDNAGLQRELQGVAALRAVNALDVSLLRLVLSPQGATAELLARQLDAVVALPAELVPGDQYPALLKLQRARDVARGGVEAPRVPASREALALMQANRLLRQAVYETSGLILDTEIASYYLGDVVATQLPRVALTQAQLADVLMRDLRAEGVPSNAERLGTVVYNELRLAEASEALSFDYGRLFGARLAGMALERSRPYQQLQQQMAALASLVGSLRRGAALGDVAQEAQFVPQIAGMASAMAQAWDDAQDELEHYLRQRARNLQGLALLVCLGMLASLASAWYLFAAFRHGTLADIAQLHRASAALLGRNSSEQVDEHAFVLPSRDELSRVSASFMAFARRLTEDNRHRAAAEAAMRVGKQAAEAALVELRDTQDKLIRSERLASLGGLVAGVAHEINTPVGIVTLSVTTLEAHVAEMRRVYESGRMRRADLEKFLDAAQQAVRLIHDNAERAATLVKSFKEVSADQVSEARRSFHVKAYVAELLESLRPSFKHRPVGVALLGDSAVEMDSYPGALAQVLSNLVMNSLNHAYPGQAGGQITIAVQAHGPTEVTLRYQDDGAGIPREHLGLVFEPFFTTRRGAGGTGLGLAIVHNIVTKVLGGSIAVSSEPGAGTVFVMTLPCTAPERQAAGHVEGTLGA